MSKLVSAVIFAGLSLFAAAAHAQFVIDMTGEAMRSALRTPALEDLHVGEAGIIQTIFLCVDDGMMATEGIIPLAKDRPKYGTYITAHKLPGGAVDLTVHSVKSDQADIDERLITLVQYSLRRPCETPVRIQSINGMTSLSALVADLASRPED